MTAVLPAEGASWVGNVFDWDTLTRPIVALSGEAVLLSILVLLLDAHTRGALHVPFLSGADDICALLMTRRSVLAHGRSCALRPAWGLAPTQLLRAAQQPETGLQA